MNSPYRLNPQGLNPTDAIYGGSWPIVQQGGGWMGGTPAPLGHTTSVGAPAEWTGTGNPGVANPSFGPSGGGGLYNEFDPVLGQPVSAVTRVLMSMGIDPSSPHLAVRNALRNADNLWSSTLAAFANGAGGGMDAIAQQPELFMAGLRQRLGEGFRGGKVLGGADTNVLGAIERLATQGMQPGGGGSAGARLLATLLADPENASSLASSLLFGGLPGRTARALSGPMSVLPTLYEQGLEQGVIGPGAAMGPVTALSLLKELYGGLYGRFQGGQGLIDTNRPLVRSRPNPPPPGY